MQTNAKHEKMLSEWSYLFHWFCLPECQYGLIIDTKILDKHFPSFLCFDSGVDEEYNSAVEQKKLEAFGNEPFDFQDTLNVWKKRRWITKAL